MHKLTKIGIVGNFYKAVSSMYHNPKSRVILNGMATDWFECPIGVKQGDIISPTLFAIYINDLAESLKESGLGIPLEDELICVLLYADDVVLLAETEEDLQILLDIVSLWCKKWRLEVNLSKTKVMHVRRPSTRRSNFPFQFDGKVVEVCDSYRYLGVVVNDTLNFQTMIENMCGSGHRALSGVITKMIKNSGFPSNVYSKLYESCVCSVSDYGAEILGYHQYVALERLHSRAIQAFLGVPRNAPNAGLRLEMNWLEPRSRTQLKMIRMYHRLVAMPNERLTKRVFLWDVNLNNNHSISTWSKEVKDILTRNNLIGTFSLNPFNLKLIIDTLKTSLVQKDLARLHAEALRSPKLRTYINISGEAIPRTYLTKPLSFIQRRFMAKLRLGILPLRIESGRYERPKLVSNQRFCQQCMLGEVEDEEHFMLVCPKHRFRRDKLLSSIENLTDFNEMSNSAKLNFLLNDNDIVKASSQYIIDSFFARVT